MHNDTATAIDSTCERRTDAPTGFSPRCGDPATAWVFTTKGTRLYLCADHAAEIDRFTSDDEDLGPIGRQVRPCSACGSLTRTAHVEPASGACRACATGEEAPPEESAAETTDAATGASVAESDETEDETEDEG